MSNCTLFKVHMTRKISHLKNTIIYEVFQSRVNGVFLFAISFYVPEIFKFSDYTNLVTGDIIGCASTVM